MLSDMFIKLWQQNLFLLGVWQTIYLTVISTVFAYVLGLPLGLLLCVSDKDGIHPMPVLNKILSIVINAFRSIPFIILMVAMLPVAKFIVGTSLGNKAVIVTLVIAAAPYVARMVESSIKEVDKGVIEAAEAMGTPPFQIITKVLVPEAKPSLITGAVISMVTVLGYSAMAGFVGGGGLGAIAINYGYYRYETVTMLVTVALMVVIVQLIQSTGTATVKRSDKRKK